MKRLGKVHEKRPLTVVISLLLPFFALLSSGLARAAAAPAPGRPAPTGTWLQGLPSLVVEGPSLWGIWRDLARLRDAELRQRADELWLTDPRLTLHAMILRAGRGIPPTVTANRRSEREAARASAREWIRERLESDPAVRELWVREARELLAGSSSVALTCATAHTVGKLRDLDLAEDVARTLASPDPQLRQAARKSLFDLYLTWFADAEAFAAFRASATEPCSEELYQIALGFERTARENGIKLLEYEPQRAPAALENPDPRVRAAAATVLGRAGNGETQGAVDRLLEHLGREVDGAAYFAALEALLQTQAAAGPDAPDVRRLRAALLRTIEEDYADLQAPVAQALSRLPWSEAAEGEDSLLVGVELLVRQLRQLASPERLTDRDVLVTSLQALLTLGGRALPAGLPIHERLAGLHDLVLRLLADQQEFGGVRIAAARLLPMVGDSLDIPRAVAVLDAPESSVELRYTLLAVLGDMARELSTDDPGARSVLDTMLARLGGDDADLRRRALSFLADEKLAALTRTANPAALVQSLGRETVPDLQAQLLSLIARYGHQQEANDLIALARFDEIANSGPAGISQLSGALRQLSGGDAELAFRSAERLLAVPNDGTRVLRLREALGLIAGLEQPAAVAMPPERDQAIVSWSRELRQAAGSVPGGQAFLHRLVEVHIPGCQEAATGGSPELVHAQALFLSDLIALDPTAGEAATVLARFGEALALATQVGDERRTELILRDRARFLHARGDEPRALADYRVLFQREVSAEPSGDGPPPVSVLELGDLRRGGQLLFAQAKGEGAAAVALEALRVSLALVRRDTWKREPAAVRTQDLRELAERALRVGQPEALGLAGPIFDGLPELPPEPVAGTEPTPLPAAPEGVRWAGLLDSREVHAQLLQLRADLALLRERLNAPPKDQAIPASAEPPAEGATPPPPDPDRVEGGGEAGDSGS